MILTTILYVALSQQLATLAHRKGETHAGDGDAIKSTAQGLQFAAEDLVMDLWGTVSSIFVAPVRGAQADGVGGFVKGIGIGIGQTIASGLAVGVDLVSNGAPQAGGEGGF